MCATLPAKASCRPRGLTFAAKPTAMAWALACGTSTRTRTGSVWARRNSGWALPPPALTRLPSSMERWVIVPAKGAVTRVNETSCSSRPMLARSAAVLGLGRAEVGARAVAVGLARVDVLLGRDLGAEALEALEVQLRQGERGLRLLHAGQGLAERRLRLGELLDDLGRVDLGEQVALRDAVAEVGLPAAHEAAGARVDPGLALGHHRTGQGEHGARRRDARLGDAHARRAERGLLGERRQGPLLQHARHPADQEQRGDHHDRHQQQAEREAAPAGGLRGWRGGQVVGGAGGPGHAGCPSWSWSAGSGAGCRRRSAL